MIDLRVTFPQAPKTVLIETALQAGIQVLWDLHDILAGEPNQAMELTFTAWLEGVPRTLTKENNKMDMRDDQMVVLTIQPLDKKGKPATVDGAPTWAGSDDTVVTVTPAPDGLSATVVGVAPGAGRVVVTADADLGAGVTPLTGTLDFTITGGSAASLSITAGDPTDQA